MTKMKDKIKITALLLLATFFVFWGAGMQVSTKAEETEPEYIYTTVDGIIYALDEENLTAQVKNYIDRGNEAVKEKVVPSEVPYADKNYTVTEIGNGAFSMSSYLEKIVLPATVSKIGVSAFFVCSALKEINLPEGIKTIQYSTFCKCTSLEEIKIPDTVEVIGELAFDRCKNLKSIKIPSGVTRLENSSLSGCEALEEVEIPDTVEYIGQEVFNGCKNLKSIKIPSSVTKLEVCVFLYCEALGEVEIPNGVKEIEEGVFVGCDALTQIVIPESVEYADKSAFSACDNLEKIFFPAHLKDVFAWGGFYKVTQISYTVNDDGTVSLTVENLPESVTGIDLPADIGGREIASITGPEGVEIPIVCAKHRFDAYSKNSKEHWYVCEVCKKEFRDGHVFAADSKPCVCGYVPFSITVQPSDLQLAYTYKDGSLAVTAKPTFGSEAIFYQWYEAGNAIAGATAAVYKIPKGKQPGSYTYSCELTSGNYSQVTKVATVTVQAPVKGGKYKDDKNMATYKVTNARTDGKGTVEYVKPVNKKKSVVTIPATVKIGGVTYKVTSIAKNAFKNNRYIKRLTIEKNVEKIGARAFYGCKKLKNITLKTTKLKTKKIGTAAFEKTPSSAKIKVPKKKLKAYKTMLLKKGVSKKAKIQKK